MKFLRLSLTCILVLAITGSAFSADYIVNGKTRTILQTEPWGAVIYSPEKMTNYSINNSVGEYRINSSQGTVKVYDSVGGITTIEFPDKKITAAQSQGILDIAFGANKYSFNYGLNGNDMNVTHPGGLIKYHYGLDIFTIEGKKGKVSYKTQLGEYTVTSSAGTSTVKSEIGGYKVAGVALSSHPYRYTLMEFYSEKYNVGLLVDLSKFYGFNELPKIFRWDEAVSIKL